MDWLTYIIVFVGCFAVTSGVHIHMMNKLEEYVDKHFLHSQTGAKDFGSVVVLNMITLLMLFLLTVGFSTFIILRMQTL